MRACKTLCVLQKKRLGTGIAVQSFVRIPGECRTKGVSYYILTKLEKAPNHIREKYLEILNKAHNTVNWKREVICSGHWSETRENWNDFPEIKYTTKYKDETAVKTN